MGCGPIRSFLSPVGSDEGPAGPPSYHGPLVLQRLPADRAGMGGVSLDVTVAAGPYTPL